jgi:glucokinase
VNRTAIGVDVGGTKTALGRVLPGGQVLDLERFRNREAGDTDALLALVADRCRRLAGEEPAAIGLALPEVLDPSRELRSHITLPWTRDRIVDALSPIGTVVLEADVRAAALAEARLGAGRGRHSVGYVSVGTGISAALVVDGRPYAGAHGAAQLLGSAQLPIDCPHCGRSFRSPALEDVAGGPALVARYNEAADAPARDGEELLERASRGDVAAERVVRRGAEQLGGYLALLVNIVDPEILVVGGGLGTGVGDHWSIVVASAREHIWAAHVRDVPIVQAELGEHAGVIGAGLLALDAVER